jgi:hypothetical protein
MAVRGHDRGNKSDTLSFPEVRAALKRISYGERATTPDLSVSTLLRFWLWGSDANEVCDRGKCDFHLMHLTGMVCTRVLAEAYHQTGDAVDTVPCIIDDADIHMLIDRCGIFLPHFYASPDTSKGGQQPMQAQMGASRHYTETDSMQPNASPTAVVAVPDVLSLQQLRDLVHALQTQWPMLQAGVDDSGSRESQQALLGCVDRLVTQIFVWFGAYLFDSDIQPWQADDTEFVHDVPPSQKMSLTDMGVKFYLNIFFVLFRLLFLQRHAVAVPRHTDAVSYPFSLESFHVEAGVDDFHMLGMYFDIPAGCLLEYKHSYSGYYNNVSQCVYRHFPSYQRRIPVSLKEACVIDAPDISVIPALKQIYPEIEFAFEDHHFQREVGSVRTAVLLKPTRRSRPDAQTQPLTQTQTPSTERRVNLEHATNVNGRRSIGLGVRPPPAPRVRSEKLQARIASCTGVGGKDNGAAATESGGRSARMADWFWFVIGGSIYLVCTLDGMVYSGPCRDLLTFYLASVRPR